MMKIENKYKLNERVVNENTTRLLRESKSRLDEVQTEGSTYAEGFLAALLRIEAMRNKNIVSGIKDAYAKKSSDISDDMNDFQFLVNYSIKFLGLKTFDDIKGIIFLAIEEIKKYNLPNTASRMGDESPNTTEEWTNIYGGIPSAKTKTDIINTSEYRHTVKQFGSIQALDAAPRQVAALISYALDKSNFSDIIKKSLQDDIDNIQTTRISLSRIIKPAAWEKLRKQFKGAELRKKSAETGVRVAGGDILSGKVRVSPEIKANVIAFKSQLELLNQTISSVFTLAKTDENFKRAFVRESLTGETMFGKNSNACANSVLTWKKDFTGISQHSIESSVKYISKTFRPPKFETKSSSMIMSATAKMAVDMKKMAKSVEESKNKNSISRFHEMLNYTNESVMKFETLYSTKKTIAEEFVSKRINEESFIGKLKDWWDSITEIASEFVSKIESFLKEVAAILNKSVGEILNFFGLEIVPEEGYVSEMTFNF